MTNDPSPSLIEQDGVIAVVRLNDLSQAVPLTEALVTGGVRAVEFTFTNPTAAEAIAAASAPLAVRPVPIAQTGS